MIRRPARFTKIKIINLNVDNSQPKRNNNSNVGNTGSPKCRQAYGDRVDVVRRIKNFERSTVKSFLNRKLYSTGSTINVERKFESFVKRAMEFPKEIIDRDLYRILCDVNFLNIAYNNIKSKPGNMTSGITTETLDGISYDILNWRRRAPPDRRPLDAGARARPLLLFLMNRAAGCVGVWRGGSSGRRCYRRLLLLPLREQ